MPGIILYGPPASGKDTVTQELVKLSPKYVPFRRLKVGPGRTAGYRMTTPEHIERLRAEGEIGYENHRYGASYYVDRTALTEQLACSVPILHLGQEAAILAVRRLPLQHRWLVVGLWCTREIAAERLARRGADDIAERLQAWDTTAGVAADLHINSGQTTPCLTATRIHSAAEIIDDSTRQISRYPGHES